jgi:phosphoserine phosphatase RsbU/P
MGHRLKEFGLRHPLLVPASALGLMLGLAVAVLGAVAVSLLVASIGMVFPGLLLFVVVFAATLAGRLVAGLLAVALSTLSLDYFVLGPHHQFGFSGGGDILALVIFGVVAYGIAHLVVLLDVARRREARAGDRATLLADASDVLARSLDEDAALRRILELLVPRLADWGVMTVVDDGAVRRIATVHRDAGLDTLLRGVASPASGSVAAWDPLETLPEDGVEVRTSVPDGVLPPAAGATSGRQLRARLGDGPAMLTRLHARGRAVGSLALVRAPRSRAFSEDDHDLVEEVANRSAMAMHTALVARAEQEAARTARVLQQLTASFARAIGVQEVCRVFATEGIPALGAWAGLVALLPEPNTIEVLASYGFHEDQIERMRRFPLDANLPLSEAMRERHPVILDTLANRDDRYPALRGYPPAEDHALVCLPLVSDDRLIGGLTASFPEPKAFSEREQAFMFSIAQQAAQALDRALVHESEARARASTERLRALTEGLAASATREEVAATVVRQGSLVVGADAALFYAVDHDDSLLLLADDGYPSDQLEPWRYISDELRAPVPDAVRSGSRIALETREAIEREYPYVINAPHDGDRSCLAAPITSGDRILGGAFFALRREHRFTDDELQIVATILRQGGQALERSELFEAERRARERAERIQLVTDAALASLEFDELTRTLLERVRESLQADTATLLTLSPSGRDLFIAASVGAPRENDIVVERGVPFGQGFAGTIAKTRWPLVVTDISERDVVSNWIRQNLSSLAGVPVERGSRLLGVLHVGFKEQHRFADPDVELLQLVASRVASAIERSQLYEDRERMARTLQRSLLPGRLPAIPGLRIAGVYRPFGESDEVGGDFYDVLPMEDGSWGIAVGDVCGKGAEAAAVMGLVVHALKALTRTRAAPAAILAELNEVLLESDRASDETFCTALFGRVDARGDVARVSLAVAGHPPALIARADGTVEFTTASGRPLGLFPELPLGEEVVELRAGDVLVAYTDGLIEQRGTPAEEGEARLIRLMRRCSGRSADEIAAALERAIDSLPSQDDDVAYLVIEKTPIA